MYAYIWPLHIININNSIYLVDFAPNGPHFEIDPNGESVLCTRHILCKLWALFGMHTHPWVEHSD